MKRITPLKLTCVGAFVAALGVGCASTGYARYDADSTHRSDVGVAASAETGTDHDMKLAAQSDMDHSHIVAARSDDPEENATVTALSFNPETRASWVNRFPFYEQNWQTRVIETYTFVAPENGTTVASRFDTSLPPNSPYVEAAGGSARVDIGGEKVIRHSPNPR